MKKTIALVSVLTFFTTSPTLADNHSNHEITADYIAGFLAGADLTDGAIIESISSGQESDFIQRAYKTRLGQDHPSVQATYLAGFCLPDDMTEKALIKKISDHINKSPNKANVKRDTVLYNAIKSLYPCKE